MARVELTGVTRRFGSVTALDALDLTAEAGKLTVVVGPSGCGKSTLLRAVAGLEGVDAGRIAIGGREVTDHPPAERGVAMVFQSFALYPHMTAWDNMAFGARRPGESKEEIARRVEEAARMLKIEPLLKRRPGALSGGQKQRVAMGRALVRKPEVFLFDEPLSSLDAALRVEMRFEVARLQEELEATMLYVTHDQVEAMTLAHRIVVMREGRIEQVGAPLALYREPANTFVAGFIGQPGMNLLPARLAGRDEGALRIELDDGGTLTLPPRAARLEDGAAVTLGVRPEHLAPAEEDEAALAGETLLVEELGAETLVYLRLAGGRRLVLRLGGAQRPRRGERLALRLDPAHCLLFDEDGKRLDPAR